MRTVMEVELMSLGKTNSVKRILTALTLSAVLASPAWSGFINNKSGWDDLLPIQKSSYAMGMLDGSVKLTVKDSNREMDLKLHYEQCVIRMKFNSGDIAELINTMYRNDVGKWSEAPHTVLLQGLYKMCGSP